MQGWNYGPVGPYESIYGPIARTQETSKGPFLGILEFRAHLEDLRIYSGACYKTQPDPS